MMKGKLRARKERKQLKTIENEPTIKIMAIHKKIKMLYGKLSLLYSKNENKLTTLLVKHIKLE